MDILGTLHKFLCKCDEVFFFSLSVSKFCVFFFFCLKEKKIVTDVHFQSWTGTISASSCGELPPWYRWFIVLIEYRPDPRIFRNAGQRRRPRGQSVCTVTVAAASVCQLRPSYCSKTLVHSRAGHFFFSLLDYMEYNRHLKFTFPPDIITLTRCPRRHLRLFLVSF